MRNIIARLDSVESVESISLLDALHYIRSSWRDVKEITIQNCFAKAGHNISINQQLIDLNSNELMVTYCNIKRLVGVTFDDFVSVDDEIKTEQNKNEEDIVRSVLEQDTLDDVSNQSTTETIVPIDYKVAFSYIDSLKSLFDLKGISTLELEAVEDQLINERIYNTKQSSILEYLIK